MSIQNIILLFHLIGALSLGILVLYTLYALTLNKSKTYKNLAVSTAYGTFFQLISGSLLALTSPQTDSLVHFCAKIGVYLTIVAITETALFMQMKKVSNLFFPSRVVFSSLTASIIFTLVTAIGIYN